MPAAPGTRGEILEGMKFDGVPIRIDGGMAASPPMPGVGKGLRECGVWCRFKNCGLRMSDVSLGVYR